jgi:putative hydrolase of the HAD superfamily
MDIVFDIGNVICEWNPLKLVGSLFSNEVECKQAIEQVISHEDWQMLDKGLLSLDEAISRADYRCSLGIGKIIALFEETPKSLEPIPETLDIIMDLSAKGYHMYILSNMHRHTFERLTELLDIWKHFSGIVISSHVKSIKPEPEIFEHLIDTYDLIPRNTVFLDDMKYNIEAAKRFGFHTIHVKKTSEIKEALFQAIGI